MRNHRLVQNVIDKMLEYNHQYYIDDIHELSSSRQFNNNINNYLVQIANILSTHLNNNQSNTNQVNNNNQNSQNYNLSFSTNYKTLPNLTLGYNFSINDNFSDVIYIDSPTVTLEYYFLDAFSFVSEYSYFHNRNKAKTIDSEYDFLTASLMYQKKGSKWEWKLSGTNLLDTKSLDTNSFSQLGGTSSFSSYRVQPRFVILSLKYTL